MPLRVTTVRLDDETHEKLSQLAVVMDRSCAWLMAHAIKRFVAQETGFVSKVELSVKAADQDLLFDHEDIKAKWRAKASAQKG